MKETCELCHKAKATVTYECNDSWFRSDRTELDVCKACEQKLFNDEWDKKERQRERRAEFKAWRDSENEKAMQSIKKDGYLVQQLSPYHYRINGKLDLFPVNEKFHNIKTNERGDYFLSELSLLLKKHFSS